MRPSVCSAAMLLAVVAAAEESTLDFGGHAKLNVTAQTYPEDSRFRDLLGSSSNEFQGDLRLDIDWRRHRWTFDADYQLIGQHRDSGTLAGALLPGALPGSVPDDVRRLFDLTKVVSNSSGSVLLHRLDRLSFAYSSEKTVLRFGRQALSWGNGLFYTPMDLVNPFDPAAIDTEYKSGDDMLYLQYLLDNGEDLQAAVVARRKPLNGDVESDQSTAALKFHGFVSDYEYDLLIAESYADMVIGIGASRAIGGAQWSADVVLTKTDLDTYVQVTTNLSYSWMLGGRNMSGVVEYHFNGFGLLSGRYAPASLAAEPDLLTRLMRGESFAPGRHYLAGSVTVEVTPLWNVAPVVLANTADPSALLQLTSNYSLSDNMTLLGSINVPLGGKGSEFGGVDAGVPDRYFSTGPGIFAQIAWYF